MLRRRRRDDADREPLEGLPAAGRARGRPRPPAPGARPRRADGRPRPAPDRQGARPDPRPPEGPHDPPLDAHPSRSRGPLRPRPHHRPRAHRGVGHARHAPTRHVAGAGGHGRPQGRGLRGRRGPAPARGRHARGAHRGRRRDARVPRGRRGLGPARGRFPRSRRARLDASRAHAAAGVARGRLRAPRLAGRRLRGGNAAGRRRRGRDTRPVERRRPSERSQGLQGDREAGVLLLLRLASRLRRPDGVPPHPGLHLLPDRAGAEPARDAAHGPDVALLHERLLLDLHDARVVRDRDARSSRRSARRARSRRS